MLRTPSRRLAVSMLIVAFLALLFVACGVPDPSAAPQSVAADPSQSVGTPIHATSPVVQTTTTSDESCDDLLETAETMDHATLERCVAVETTAFAHAAPSCPADFNLSVVTDETLGEFCGRLRETADALEIVSRLLTPTVLGPTETPVAATPIPRNYIPDDVKTVRPVAGEDMVGLRFLRSATSVWQLGGLSDVNGYNYNHVWVWTKPPGAGADRATIGFFVIGDADTNEGTYYRMVWETPEDVGALTITGISAVTLEREQVAGLVTFTTSTGRNGTFDLASQHWSIAP